MKKTTALGFGKRTLAVQLTIDRIRWRLESSEQFEGTVGNTGFEIREKRWLTNKFLLPIINGTMEAQDDGTNVVISFKTAKFDKLGLGIFLLIIVMLSLLSGLVASDALLSAALLCWGVVLGVIFWIYYVTNCRRAYKKLRRILED